jgi:predicted ATP-grasp superfamily ATP-dependent carboligase
MLILGASTRAAAFSALRAGLRPYCVDHFADRDLAEVCPVERVSAREGAPRIVARARLLPAEPWLYTGPLENHPTLVHRLARSHRLLGNSAASLVAVRDPFAVADALHRRGLACAPVMPSSQGLSLDRGWLIKPLASGGGRAIRFLDNQAASTAEPCYFQQFIDGPSFSALFVADHGKGRPLGITRQLLGAPGLPFAYGGSIGPVTLSGHATGQLSVLGQVLTSEFELVGLFGIDFLLRDDEPVAVEVNPRYTASVEVLELAAGRSLLAEHLRACDFEPAERSRSSDSADGSLMSRVVGKTILYAEQAMVAPEIGPGTFLDRDPVAIPSEADIPWPGTHIAAGDPVMTIFALERSARACEHQLALRAADWNQRFLNLQS